MKTVKAQVLPSHGSAAVSCDFLPTAETKQDLEELNEQLADRGFASAAIKKLNLDLCPTIEKSVISCLRRIANNSVWRQYSHKGQRGSLAYVDLVRVNQLVISTLVKYRKSPTDGKEFFERIEKCIKTFLAEQKRRRGAGSNQGAVKNEL